MARVGVAVRFGVLGAIAVWRGGAPVDVGHARQRWVLGALLADADGVVPTDVLVDRVWGADAPGRQALYGYVSRLRQVLSGVGADIVRDNGGYRLKVLAGSVDAHRFRDLADQARAVRDDEQAASLWEEALGLWRGDAFAGIDTLVQRPACPAGRGATGCAAGSGGGTVTAWAARPDPRRMLDASGGVSAR
ncbi:hypothetical protein SHKM778_45590 [Streptomyces sp. KM77-8]|uniref:OmpR/PhoB-type domain-containing protein n=1 Tax=Streptomyces haneummycinicus TaxID=3074435 RepID=A0AAT9HLG7_9ACTN